MENKKLNENVELFILEDWVGNLLGKYKTLDEVEENQQKMVDNDSNYKNATTEEEREEIENGIYEDLYVFGLDKDGNVVPVEFG